jgi:hypothetical protein
MTTTYNTALIHHNQQNCNNYISYMKLKIMQFLTFYKKCVTLIFLNLLFYTKELFVNFPCCDTSTEG